MDISEQCGYSLAQQAALFHSIKPLFANKPLLVVVNKTDVRPLSDLSPEETALLQEMEDEARRISSGGEARGEGEGGVPSPLPRAQPTASPGTHALTAPPCTPPTTRCQQQQRWRR